VSLSDADYKVSELCLMTDQKLFKLVESATIKDITEPTQFYISQLISAGMRYDEQGFGKIFTKAILRFGMKDTYLQIIYPMLVRLGFMWSSDTIPPAHEHFISNLIRQKLGASIEALPPAKSLADSWLLFLPENEFHETGLLFANYLIKSSGKKVSYLGSNMPLQSLQAASENIAPTNLLLFFVLKNNPDVARRYLSTLSKDVRSVNIYVAGSKSFTDQLGKIKKVRFLNSVDDLLNQLL
jgi:hypothetical protein